MLTTATTTTLKIAKFELRSRNFIQASTKGHDAILFLRVTPKLMSSVKSNSQVSLHVRFIK